MNNRATFGVEYQNNVKTALSLATEDRFTYFEADIPFTVMSIYAFDEYQISKDLLISFGARHDRNSKDESSATVPRAALIVHPFRSSSVKLLYGEAFRAPGFVERDLAVPFLLAPNPNLRPERVRSYEAVWEQRVGQSYFATISLYRNDLFDMIRTLSTEVLPTKYDNIGRARATGVEVEAWARWSNGAGGFASVTFQNTVNAETDERLDYSPQYLVKAGAYAPILDAMIIGLNGRYMSSQYKLAHPNETARRETDGNFVTDMTLTSKPILNVLRLRLSVTNLLDTDYEFPIERYDIDLDGDRVPDKVLDSATQDGRRFVVSATAQF